MWLVVGLGNPGSQYHGNRHNVGFMVVDALIGRARFAPARAKFGAEIVEGELANERVLFCKPMEFMNVSGHAVARAAQFWKVAPARTVVVHDELDLPFAQLKLSTGGGAGGHNGLKSLIADWGTPDFSRVRVGIGRPPGGGDVSGYVLANFNRAEQAELPAVIQQACEAVVATVGHGITTAMNKFNVKKKKEGLK